MSPDQYSELLTTVLRMCDTAHVLSRSMEMFAQSEKDPSKHSTFWRLHVALNDCALGLRHALDAAPPIDRMTPA
jgi:hypothetical protein